MLKDYTNRVALKRGHDSKLDMVCGNKIVNNDPSKYFLRRDLTSFVPMGSSQIENKLLRK